MNKPMSLRRAMRITATGLEEKGIKLFEAKLTLRFLSPRSFKQVLDDLEGLRVEVPESHLPGRIQLEHIQPYPKPVKKKPLLPAPEGTP